MSVEQNLRVVDEWNELINAGDLDRAGSLTTESVVRYGPERPEPLKGFPAIREHLQEFSAAFPDSRTEKERVFCQGDWVCGEFAFSGTHTGPLTTPNGLTTPATNKSFRFPYCVVYRFNGGKIAEAHVYYDRLGFLAQLGLAP